MNLIRKLSEKWKDVEHPFLIHSSGELSFDEVSSHEPIDLSEVKCDENEFNLSLIKHIKWDKINNNNIYNIWNTLSDNLSKLLVNISDTDFWQDSYSIFYVNNNLIKSFEDFYDIIDGIDGVKHPHHTLLLKIKVKFESAFVFFCK